MRPITAIIVMTFFAGGCTDEADGPGGGNGGRVVATCSRLDECNFLEGISEQECVDILDHCVEDLPAGYQHDWGVIMDDCLDRQSCSLFGDCVVIPCEQD